MRELILKIENFENMSLEKIEKEKVNCEKIIKKKEEEAKNLISKIKKDNTIKYKKEIENYIKLQEEEKKEFLKLLESKILKFEKKFEDNKKLASNAIIEKIKNIT